MSSLSKGVGTVEVALRWDPSPMGAAPHDLDIVAATYPADAPMGDPAYVVHFDSRSPDGTIGLARDSRTGQGFGFDEVLKAELTRLAPVYGRVVVGVVVQQKHGRLTLGEVAGTLVRVSEGPAELWKDDLSGLAGFTAAVVAEFVRTAPGVWEHRPLLRGMDADPQTFLNLMGRAGA
ncbi:TerD family protein [Streptomyces yaizuensis]|uniref:TerD family protein n=1 Tax=Streptomyces yaizuensis TaxID=2989713 RepID=A0ABQ5PAQ0_9ACTN|nr:TerD family protein [Streptomyces sp. YSPA8]GLF99672.1 TerD family protein [Streptomyces sp. YSPA8]